MSPKHGKGERMTKSGVEAKESMIDVPQPPPPSSFQKQYNPYDSDNGSYTEITRARNLFYCLLFVIKEVRCWHFYDKHFNRMHFVYFGMFRL
jgi:hypothetical protein